MDRESKGGVTHHPRHQQRQRERQLHQPHLREHGVPEQRAIGKKRRAPSVKTRHLGARAASKDFTVGQRGGGQDQDVDADTGDACFARSVMLKNDWSKATGNTTMTPITPNAPANAPVSIMPSTLMFKTPARSLTNSPMAPSTSELGTADTIPC